MNPFVLEALVAEHRRQLGVGMRRLRLIRVAVAGERAARRRAHQPRRGAVALTRWAGWAGGRRAPRD
ncbi:MAG TPA: hypothetical protein VMW49_00755 [Candidatus Dormibacteraeota bacterium]|nr:hypothetical protein [Candidatus Dormibacteraeota bacterium]